MAIVAIEEIDVSADAGTPTQVVAYHEAGHAVVAYFLRWTVTEVSSQALTTANGTVAGYTKYAETAQEAVVLASARAQTTVGGGFLNDVDRRWVETRLMVLLAGGIAEQQGQGATTPPPGVAGDAALAARVLDKASLPGERGAYCDWLEARTRTLLEPTGRPWRCVQAVHQVLKDGATLDGATFLEIVNSIT